MPSGTVQNPIASKVGALPPAYLVSGNGTVPITNIPNKTQAAGMLCVRVGVGAPIGGAIAFGAVGFLAAFAVLRVLMEGLMQPSRDKKGNMLNPFAKVVDHWLSQGMDLAQHGTEAYAYMTWEGMQKNMITLLGVDGLSSHEGVNQLVDKISKASSWDNFKATSGEKEKLDDLDAHETYSNLALQYMGGDGHGRLD